MTAPAAVRRPAGFAVAFVALYQMAVRTAAGQQFDIGCFASIDSWNHQWGGVAGNLRWSLVGVGLVALVIASMVALVGRRFRAVAAATIVVTVSCTAAVSLKPLLTRPYIGEFGYLDNTFPSGHTIAATALLAGLFFVMPVRWRTPRVAAGYSVLAVLASASSVVSLAHRPSDVLGGLFLVGAVATPAAMVAESGPPSDSRRAWVLILGAGTLSLVVAVVALLAVDGGELRVLLDNLAVLCAVAAASSAVFWSLLTTNRRSETVNAIRDANDVAREGRGSTPA